MYYKDLFLNFTDLVFYLSDFLDDTSSFRLFNTKRSLNYIVKNCSFKYTVKRPLSNDHYFNKSLLKYKIKIYYESRDLPIELLDIPKNVQELHFKNIDGKFNQSLDDLPSNLKKLVISSSTFNQSLDKLPKSLTDLDLKCCRNFNQSIDNLPSSLKILNLGGILGNFNQSVDNLPLSLEHLTLGAYFDKSLDNLPKSLLSLHLEGSRFNKSINNLPKGLLSLKLEVPFFNQSLDRLPESLLYLYLQGNFNQSINYLPKNLLSLKLTGRFNQSVDKLPSKLQELTLGYYFNQSLDKLPENLRVLDLQSCMRFDKTIYIDYLPKGLKELILTKFIRTKNCNDLS